MVNDDRAQLAQLGASAARLAVRIADSDLTPIAAQVAALASGLGLPATVVAALTPEVVALIKGRLELAATLHVQAGDVSRVDLR